MPDIATLKAAKFWVAVVGAVLAAFLAVEPDAPRWLFAVAASVSALAVYLVPNKDAADE